MIDLERFVRSRVTIRNESGGRGYDAGLRAFDCPLCGDDRARGWVGVSGWGAGCFNVGCEASPRLDGGAVEWARRALGLGTRGEAWAFLRREFGTDRVAPLPAAARLVADFCRLPSEARLFSSAGSERPPMEARFEEFAEQQWGLRPADLRRWDLRWCLTGRYAWRVVIPVVMGGAAVGFQARTIRSASFGDSPKYVTSRHGSESDPLAECGRPAAAMLFGADAMVAGRDALLVEGAGDAMAWGRQDPAPLIPVALLGTALTQEKLEVIAAAGVGRVVVALDDEPAATRRAERHVEDLRAWGVGAVLGRWVGGKDAGSGARLTIESR